MSKKWLFLSLCTISFALITSSFSNVQKSEPSGIQFFGGSLQEAMDKAKQENKFLFLDAYASWCGPCKLMKRKTFVNKAVADFYNQHFVCIAIDMEKGEGISLSTKFDIQAYPTLIFFAPSGQLKMQTVGYHNAKEFMQLGENIVNGKK